MSEEGQAPEQPQLSPMEMAVQAATNMIAKEQGVVPEPQQEAQEKPEEAEERPRGPDGKFIKAEGEEPEVKQTIKYKVKHKDDDGTEVEAEYEPEELVKGYMRQKDYSRKTAELARQREAAQKEAQEAIAQRAQALDQKYQEAERIIMETAIPGFEKIDWNTLARENPAEWAAKFQSYQNVQARLTAIRTERQHQAESFAREQQSLMLKQAQEAVEALQTKIPGWSDETYRSILKAAQQHYGFKTQEVGAITDPRAIEVLHDAMQYRALKAKPVAEKKVVKEAPKVIKPGAGAEEKAPNRNAEVLKERSAQLSKTGRRDDAVAYAAALLDAGRI